VKQLNITIDEKPLVTVPVEDAFVWSTLKEAPDWVSDLVLEGEAWAAKGTKTIIIRYKNGFVTADVGDIVIRFNKDVYTVIYNVEKVSR
jgi:hypothetical protein